jgi:hypothetical protein
MVQWALGAPAGLARHDGSGLPPAAFFDRISTGHYFTGHLSSPDGICDGI